MASKKPAKKNSILFFLQWKLGFLNCLLIQIVVLVGLMNYCNAQMAMNKKLLGYCWSS